MNKPNRVIYVPVENDRKNRRATAIKHAMIDGYPVMFHDHKSGIRCINYKLVYDPENVPISGCWFWGQ